jgi:AcrR family transcriptional regulator
MGIDRKKLIVEAATKSFSQFGYKATTIDQVAKIANVGKGTIYTFFKNKEELFDEIITSLIKELKVTADEAFLGDLPFHEKLHQALYRILEFRMSHQLSIKLFQEAREIGTPAVVDVINRMENNILRNIEERVAKAIETGSIQSCDPKVTAFVMLKLYIALIFDWEKNNPPLEKDEIAKLFEQYIFKGLSK